MPLAKFSKPIVKASSSLLWTTCASTANDRLDTAISTRLSSTEAFRPIRAYRTPPTQLDISIVANTTQTPEVALSHLETQRSRRSRRNRRLSRVRRTLGNSKDTTHPNTP